jgi:hypothetical protein
VAAFADWLVNYGMTRVGSLWNLERGIVRTLPAVYAFTAPNGFKTWGAWHMSPGFYDRNDDNVGWVEPSEVFYLGVSRSLRSRINR